MKKQAISLGFFDYTQNYGGAPKGSIELLSNWAEHYGSVYAYDAVGASKQYREAVLSGKGINYRLCSDLSGSAVVGYEGGLWTRLVSVLRFVPVMKSVVVSLRRSIKNDTPEVMLVNNPKSLLTAWLACFGLPVKLVSYVRGRGAREDLGLMGEVLNILFANLVLCHSYESLDNLQRLRLFGKRVEYVPNSVEIAADYCVDRKIASKDKTIRLLLPAARIVREKGIEEAIRAVAILREEYQIELFLSGSLPYGVGGGFQEEMAELITGLGLCGDVQFIGFREDIHKDIRNSDIVILPSYSEGFPRVILESMALCTAFVVTPVAGLGCLNDKYSIGRICDFRSPQSLASEIKNTLVKNGETSSRISNAKKYYESNHTKAVRMQCMYKVLSEVVYV